jgi:transcriptional regulator of arginine metabolism
MSPATKAARQAQIAGILEHAQVRSQEELAGLLADRGVHVAQATLSRDLEEMGVVRLRGAAGALFYALPEDPGGPGSRPGGVGAAAPERVPGHGAAGAALPRAGAPGAGVPGAGVPGAGVPGAAHQAGDESGAGAGAGAGAVEPAASGALPRIAGELLVSAEASANLVVLRTPAGGAQLLASALDHASWPAILGTVAGDDTVLVISRDPAGGNDLAQALLRQAERRT